MFEKRTFLAILFVSSIFSAVLAEVPAELEDNWNDFLHYAATGRLDLAQGYAENIINSDPDPVDVLALSEKNSKAYSVLLMMNENSEELRQVSGSILELIEKGRFIRRTDAVIIAQEIRRLSSGTIRGNRAAQSRLNDAGEYAIPFMLDALADRSRKTEFVNISRALPAVGKDAIRPLVTALVTDNIAVKSEIIRALGAIGYPQSLGYLKYVVENDKSDQLKELAENAIKQIDPSAMQIPAAELLFSLGESYYDHAESLAVAEDVDFGNVWFWDTDARTLKRVEVNIEYFYEAMAMRSCEWALKADQNIGKAIALWIAAFFKAEATGLEQPSYFSEGHGDAMMYATTAGPEYLHQALERALADENDYVALGVVEALAANAGEKSLLYKIGVDQPLVKALSYSDTSVKYSAAIAIAVASPQSNFIGSNLIIENLTEALAKKSEAALGEELAAIYAERSVAVMLQLAIENNEVVDLSYALKTLVKVTKDETEDMQDMAAKVLARLESPDAQRGIVEMGLLEDNSLELRISAFDSLAVSAKKNTSLLTGGQIDRLYQLVGSDATDPALRQAAASAYGALNLPSKKVKDLILDQAKN